MAILTNSDFADAMKTYYLGPLNELVYQTQAFLNRVEKTGEDVAGNFAYVPVISGRNPAVGSRKDATSAGVGPALPAHGRQTYDAYTFKMAFHYGRGSISGPVMRQSRSDAGAFAKALDVEMKGLMKSLPSMLNRQLWSYGHGRAATLEANVASGASTMEVSSTSVFSLKIGDRICLATIAAGAGIQPAAGAIVTAISRDKDAAGVASATKHYVTFDTVTAGAKTATADAVYFGGGATLTAKDISRSQEMYGIPALIDDGAIGADEDQATVAGELLDGSLSVGSIDRTAVAAAQSIVLTNPSAAGTNRAVTVNLLEEAFLQFQHVAGGDVNNLEMYTNPGLWATIGLLHIGDRRYNDYREKVEGGFTAIMFNGRPIFSDRDAIRDIIWYLDMSNIMLLTQGGFELMDEDGAVLARISDTDAYEFTLYRDAQLGLRNGRTHVKLDDCTSTFNVEANI